MSKVIFIDAGHGGNDPGASGHGLLEKDITLNVSKMVKGHLERHGVKVVISRESDKTLSLSERSNMANKYNLDASISIHCNAFNGSAKGIETFSYGRGVNELRLAQCVHSEVLAKKLYTLDRGVKQANYHMVREVKAAAILIEMAFIDSAVDNALLKSKQNEFAIAIATGLLKYVGITYKAPVSNTAPSKSQMYRVRLTWANVSSQKGAFTDLNNAKELCDKHPGYSVFDEAGKAVYTCKPAKAEMYRVRLTWANASSQKGAFTDLGNAKELCDKNPGYSVFNEAGKAVYTSKKVLAVGSKVKITGSKYATGEAIPSWIKSKTYTVQQISGSKALIKEIVSWVLTKDLQIL